MIERSYRIELGEFSKVRLILAGCGGTGSFAALHLARLGYVLREKGLEVKLMFVDFDTVEAGNIGRQNFCPAEIGQPKAATLAWRYASAFGLDIQPVVERFRALVGNSIRYGGYNEMTVVIGAVDSPGARQEIRQMPWGSKCWWLDSGNDLANGQVLLGNWHQPQTTIDPLGFATMVPLPSVQEPGIIEQGSKGAGEQGSSCAELLIEESQSLMINQMMASWLGAYLSRLLVSQDLDVMATYVNLNGAVRSVPITGERQVMARARPEVGVIGPEEWRTEEWFEIAEGTCPECGGDVAEGRNNWQGLGEIAIFFCPTCTWELPVADVERRLGEMAEVEAV